MLAGRHIIDSSLLYSIMSIKSETYDLDGKENIVVKTWNRLYINDFLRKNIKGHSKANQWVCAQSVGIFETGLGFPTLVIVQGYLNCLWSNSWIGFLLQYKIENLNSLFNIFYCQHEPVMCVMIAITADVSHSCISSVITIM